MINWAVMVKIDTAVHCREKLPVLAFLPFSFLGKNGGKKLQLGLHGGSDFPFLRVALKHSVFSVWFGWWLECNSYSTFWAHSSSEKKGAGLRKTSAHIWERMNFLLHNTLEIKPVSVGMLPFEDINSFFFSFCICTVYCRCSLQFHIVFCWFSYIYYKCIHLDESEASPYCSSDFPLCPYSPFTTGIMTVVTSLFFYEPRSAVGSVETQRIQDLYYICFHCADIIQLLGAAHILQSDQICAGLKLGKSLQINKQSIQHEQTCPFLLFLC